MLNDRLDDWQTDDVGRLCANLGLVVTTPPPGTHVAVSHPSRPEILIIPAHGPLRQVYVRELLAFAFEVTRARERRTG